MTQWLNCGRVRVLFVIRCIVDEGNSYFSVFFIEHAKRINKNEKKNAFKESARVNVEKKPTSGINI